MYLSRRLGNESTGALLGLGSAIASAAYLLCIREAMALTSRVAVVFVMLFGAAALSTALAVTRRASRRRPNGKWITSVLLLAALTIIGNVALATALPRLGPGVTSTLLQAQVLVIAFLAWIFLREAVGSSVLFGAVVAAGGFAFFAMPGQSAQSVDSYGLLAGMVTTFCFAAMLVWTLCVIFDLDPVALNAARLWLAVLAMALWPGVLASAFAMPGRAWTLALGAALTGPFIGRLAIIYALRFISAAKSKLWGMLSPVFAFLFVYLLYGIVPTSREALGGLLMIAGVLLPTLHGLRQTRRLMER